MRRFQFDTLLHEHDARYGRYLHEDDFKSPVRVVLKQGRHKGKLGTVKRISGSELTIAVDGVEKEVRLPYSKVDLVDAEGNPIIAPVTDMTGRTVEPGAVLCYSVSVGENSHALEIGQVLAVNESGTLSVKAIIRNGEKAPVSWRGERPKLISDPDRCILLPLDAELVATWLLTEFEMFKPGDIIGAEG